MRLDNKGEASLRLCFFKAARLRKVYAALNVNVRDVSGLVLSQCIKHDGIWVSEHAVY